MKSIVSSSQRILIPVLVCAILIGGALWLGDRIARAVQPLSRNAIAQRLLNSDRPYDASLVFEDPVWKGIALFQAGRYQRASASFQAADSEQALYNLGVSYAHLRRFPDAIATFQLVVVNNPEHADAQFNLDLLRQIKKDEEEQERSDSAPDQGSERQQVDKSDADENGKGKSAPELEKQMAERQARTTTAN